MYGSEGQNQVAKDTEKKANFSQNHHQRAGHWESHRLHRSQLSQEPCWHVLRTLGVTAHEVLVQRLARRIVHQVELLRGRTELQEVDQVWSMLATELFVTMSKDAQANVLQDRPRQRPMQPVQSQDDSLVQFFHSSPHLLPTASPGSSERCQTVFVLVFDSFFQILGSEICVLRIKIKTVWIICQRFGKTNRMAGPILLCSAFSSASKDLELSTCMQLVGYAMRRAAPAREPERDIIAGKIW